MMKRRILAGIVVLMFVVMGTAQTQWPDLTWIKVGGGKTCSIDGAATNADKAALNRLKNRFTLPDKEFKPITFDELRQLDQGKAVNGQIVNFPGSSHPDNAKAVSLEGFVAAVSTGGCSSGESCNCKTTIPLYCDTHIDVYPAKDSPKKDGHNRFVVEITRRIRILAWQGLLESNVGKDWSTAGLQKLVGHRVRFSGYLYFDTDHSQEAWVNDASNKIGFQKDHNGNIIRDHNGNPIGNNWRETAWEIHPVMKIELLN